MANQNGMIGQNAAGYNALAGQGAIPAGHFSDMQHLDRNMENLSMAVQENRAEWQLIEELLMRASRIQGRVPRDDSPHLTNGVHPDPPDVPDVDQPTVEQLQSELAAVTARAETEKAERDHIIEEYVNAFNTITPAIHDYRYGYRTFMHNTLAHYNKLLEQAREETLNARLENQAWQAGLKRLSEGLRAASQARDEEGMPWKRRIAALKEENRILRAKVGWDPPVDSDDEGEESAAAAAVGGDRVPAGAAAARMPDPRGRSTQASQLPVSASDIHQL